MKRDKKFITCDGNYAAAHISYIFSEVAAIYPITPSSPMAESVDEWAAEGRKNIFGSTVKVIEMQSEAGAAGATHGSLQSGALTTTYTASQGLLLMIPNMYKIAGELLPGVFHVSARTLAAHALSIFGDHSDVMATRMTGFALLATSSVQEIMDLAPVAHLAAIKGRVPFLHFFDGFRTSHEIQKIEMLDAEDFIDILDWKAVEEFRSRSLNPNNSVIRGTAQNPDIFFQAREAAQPFYDKIPDIVESYMQEIKKLTGREYHPFDYYGHSEAEYVIVAMGSVADTVKDTIDYLMNLGEKVGLINVHLYRPFSEKYFLNVIPKSVKKIAVLDRTKEPGATGEPLYLDVKNIFYDKPNAPEIYSGRYGLSSKDTTPSQIIAVYNNLKQKESKNHFTIGIVDDISFSSLPLEKEVNISHQCVYSARFYGIGSDGTVGANKNSIKIIGDTTDKYCQAYFAYDSKKSGGFTVSHLRFGDIPIRSPYLVTIPDFVACHVPAYLGKYDMLSGLKPDGTFLLNTNWDVETTKEKLPNSIKKYLAVNNIKFYVINATQIAREIGLGNRTNSIMQSAFFKITNIIPYDLAVKEMRKAVEESFGRKGEKVVQMNYQAIERGAEVVEVQVPEEWKNLPDEDPICYPQDDAPEFISQVARVMNAQEGDKLPVSTFKGMEDGTFPTGTSKYEKRGIAVTIPVWLPENCTQCNQCAYVCPHAVIRPFLLTDEELANAPAGTKSIKGSGATKEYNYTLQVSVLDCTGCEVCINICPAKEKALVMEPLEDHLEEDERFKYMDQKVGYKDTVVDKYKTVRGSQFAQPLFEFSGACAGCGETPYIKLITQLFGERMVIANATGCSSIYGASAPSMPYTTSNRSGRGIAWANSLFEDNAEYAFGIASGIRKIREYIKENFVKFIANSNASAELKKAMQEWIDGMNDAQSSEHTTEKILSLLSGAPSEIADFIRKYQQYLIKISVWGIGGDGWAYDIGYGGLDHVLASGEDINILVLDTEVYSNTGGQSSKATPIGAIAKFAASGKKIRKKDLGLMAISYGYVYVAQVAMGANINQYLKVIREAEEFPGPSLIIAYAPCIAHGIKGDMRQSQNQEDRAVKAGYWTLYRYDPRLANEGKIPFQLDSKEPDFTQFQEFLLSELRFSSLMRSNPEAAKELFDEAERVAKWRYDRYVKLSQIIF
ncbi:MAG: pyruvate:ferredoxin (flavodoxin) oxidoreductase [Bacteroidales bacterium]|jgi:pyruvate-ferredoxin/flavodoxin oxidoreductase|nr:pyruvate:ferredoxin (flavodoxin) oxidoreductase [Bacteroidales bacterium]MDI9575760.1 pyruvate:ferredoxin (flavodoxin) oxidoreductase [Bacteroidota bacterium]MDD2592884.1 pyruvate:ferredoxin (flavodoxin) oxidoreductase [Bacteroidales bacterium]MDD3755345.1 pyruvate:ferredoxin (flavodoxin) oxidoreductase [Bacteroidales bacterium]MDY0401023.1 pyruvate:ferredoxin (flavodoxin) oxidoreductase [Bacteroidales bacterium]